MAMQNFDPSNDEDIRAEINMTPLIDIMLVLLIIFMVTSSVSLESGLSIDIPKTSSKTKGASSQGVIISLNDQGELFVQGQATPKEELQASIAKAMSLETSKVVILEGDYRATLGRAIEIMDIAKAAGAEKFAIAAENAPE